MRTTTRSAAPSTTTPSTRCGRAVREFRNKSFKPALNVVREIYPEARFDVTERGLILHPSKPHVPQIKGQGDLF